MGIQALRKQRSWLADQSGLSETDEVIEAWRAKSLKKLREFNDEMAQELEAANTNPLLRKLIRNDLFILLSMGCHRYDMLNNWCIARCDEVQENQNGFVDLWPREHYKSTIITFGLTLMEILRTHGDDVESSPATIGIFSYTRPIAKAFLRQIKLELERNQLFQLLFPDIFYLNPTAQSPKWSEDEGIIVKRLTNPKESTVEAWGLIDGQPTSKHFSVCVYDDIVTHDKVRTEYSRERVIAAWENSLSLGQSGGHVRYIGTRKHLTDVYSEIMARNAGTKRLYTPWEDKEKTKGVLFTPEELNSRRRKMGEITWAAEYENDPMAASSFTLDYESVQRHNLTSYENLNLYLIGDPSSGRTKKSDYTALTVIGIDRNTNIILIDGIRDRLNLSQRADAFFMFHDRYPKIIKYFYEETGLCSDLEYFKERMTAIQDLFYQKIVPLKPSVSKQARILKLEPFLTELRIFVPDKLPKMSVHGISYDLVHALLYEEMKPFPFPRHDDLLDDLAYAVENIQNGQMIAPKGSDDLKSFYEKRAIDISIMDTRQVYGCGS